MVDIVVDKNSEADSLKSECETLFRGFWHLICHKSEVREHNQFVRRRFFNEEIVIYNDFGNIIAFDNLCPHRGTSFFSGLRGAGPLKCPYHGLSYVQGKIFVKEPQSFRSPVNKIFRLNEAKVKECGDFLFVALEPRIDLHAQLGAYFDVLKNISLSIDKHSYDIELDYSSNWKNCVANAMETYHISEVHGDTLAKLEFRNYVRDFCNLNSSFVADLADTKDSRILKIIAKGLQHSPYHEGYFSFYIFPFTFISSTFGLYFSVQTFMPASNASTNFLSSAYAAKGIDERSSRQIQALTENSREYNTQVFLEDMKVCEKVKWTFTDRECLHYSSHEDQIVAFQRSYFNELRRI